MNNDTVLYKSSNTHCNRTPIQEMIVAGLNRFEIPNDLILTKEQCLFVKDVLSNIHHHEQTEVEIVNRISEMSSEIGITFNQARSIIAKIWVAAHWRWDCDVEQYLKKKDWEHFVYNKGNSLEIALPRTDDVNKIIHNQITVTFEGYKYYEEEQQIGSFYYDRPVEI